MIKKNLAAAVLLFLLTLLYTACQTSGAIGAKEAAKVDFRTLLAAGAGERVLVFLEKGVSLVDTDVYGETPLFTAARYGPYRPCCPAASGRSRLNSGKCFW